MSLSGPLAVIADIHGNALALAAVLDDIAALGVTRVVNLGDVFSGPMDPAGVWDLLKGRDILTVRGNHDRALVDFAPEEMWETDRLTHGLLPAEAFDWIRALPAEARLEGVYLCHGTPGQDDVYWAELVEGGRMVPAPPDRIEALAGPVTEGLMLCGHTHIPRVVRLRDGRLLVNPGSVGCPGYTDDRAPAHVMMTGTPTASYAVVEAGTAGWSVTHRSVCYDWDAAAEQARGHGRADWAKVVGTGWL
ncbi:DNA methylase [Primorskyibacter flagellatus]|uniref:DNA methylase n=1 Tax=Primorskyibacter flagellatus TaxID=1387277 RepID=A0A917EBR0_9RHOB|nr:metallophosphoesterase family protein [Primorskyibacter flagellatus]GGE21960.1 DNA methylase [Primorskyibacter flagellatus]